jgi:NCS1 family nucleobase:cation symporter-1
MGLALLGWAYTNADGFGPMLSQPDRFETRADFWKVFFPGLTAMVGFWATLSLNIPDFTREAKSQRPSSGASSSASTRPCRSTPLSAWR